MEKMIKTIKKDFGGDDIEDSKMAKEMYKYWEDIGKPNMNGGKWK